MEQAKRFDGFVSYSHKTDSHIASALHTGLRRFGRPWYKLSSTRVFRDETNLTATPSLWGDVKNALDASEYLILMASPAAAKKSDWVPRELAYWLTGGRYEDPAQLGPDAVIREQFEHLLIVLSDGNIVWDNERGDFDWLQTDALPDALASVFDNEPFWVDLRWARALSQSDLGRRNRRFNEALAKLLSPIRGKDYLALLDEEVAKLRPAE